MKHILTIVFLFISLNVFPQISLPYYYVIPPSGAGCNGEVAIDSRPITGAMCTGPYSYTCDCSADCLFTIEFVQDTIFIHDVCTLPCNFIATDADGALCFFCGVGLPSGIAENLISASIVFNQQMSMLEIKNIISGNYTLSVTDLAGKLISKNNFTSKSDQVAISLTDLSSGIYLFSLEGNNKRMSGKIVKQ